MPDDTIGTEDEHHPKHRDPYRFIPADEFFDRELSANTLRPDSVTYNEKDQLDATGKAPNSACGHGRVFRLSTGAPILIQFMRPLVWRIRFYPHYKEGHEFTDYNTRTIIRGNLTNMIEILDQAEGIAWSVQFDDSNPRYYNLRSVDGNGNPMVQLWIQRDPFRIMATRTIKTPRKLKMHLRDDEDSHLPISAPAESGQAVIWKTKKRPLQYQARDTQQEPSAIVLSVEKPDPARYMGFGEQGGKDLFKDNTYMNYFNFDNMRYNNVYGRGPFENAEPLYHSEPYFIEVNGHPGYMSQLATFIDNYSHVCVDLGKTNTTQIRIATRFNGFQGIFIAGNDISEVIRRYSSLIGRPRLMPRFVLGNHQGCYGYDRQQRVEQAVQKYRDYGIPLDGMHIDVDIQRGYRTFTIDKGKFPEPEKMFLELRKKGVRCSTNITPVINARDDAEYTTLNEGLSQNHFVLDRRNVDPSAPNWWDQRYMQYGGSNLYYTRPFQQSDPEEPDDDHEFSASFNNADRNQLFRGGVSYGNKQGCPGYYPNLNQRRTRDWWGKQYEYLFKTGLEFVWQDMTSPCMAQRYGDMKSWPFRLMLDSDGWPGETKAHPDQTDQKTAIEIWSLYSFNLHKATFKGLNRLDSRKGKRNFIIGRGSYAGAQRYAGLWTGDNASTWDFLQISVAQVIALGLAGVTIAGADVGGFEPPEGNLTAFADPELLIRWYCAYSLLPWFRNHYTAKHTDKENVDWKKKDFQEPYRYFEWYRDNWRQVADGERDIYQSVLPVSRYCIRLRYSLLQLLYDAMFENSITGLPIARSLVITDPLDGSLFSRHEWANKSQYMVRNDILVAPQLEQKQARREIYFPSTTAWFPMNLRPHYDDAIGEALQPSVPGGSNVSFDCHIGPEDSHLPYVCPMYIREGAIIPQIQVRDSVPDRTRPELPAAPANPITINIYPGHSSRGPSKYSMYLDDGVSRSSAPDDAYLFLQPADGVDEAGARPNNEYGDKAARSNFRRVDVEQNVVEDADGERVTGRRITLSTGWKGVGGGVQSRGDDVPDAERYDDEQVERDVGAEYRLVVWHEPQTDMAEVAVNVLHGGGIRVGEDVGKKASVVWVPTKKDVEAVMEVVYQ